VARCANILRMTTSALDETPLMAAKAPQSSGQVRETETSAPDGILADVLIEEISIDGMCGVY
jgi:mycofactocin precursor